MAKYDKNTTVNLGDILTNKRGSEWIRVSRVTNEETGVESYDVRTWYMDDNNEEQPTYKGFRMKRTDIVDALSKIEDNLDIDNYDVAETLEEGEDRKVLEQYKSGREELIVARIVARDKNGVLPEEKCIDIRKWYYDENEELKPTKKGIRLKGEVLFSILGLIDGGLKVGEAANDEVETAND